MKKSINIVLVFFAIISFVLLIVSSMKCIDGVARLSIDDSLDTVTCNNNLIAITLVPTLFSLLAFSRASKVLNIMASISLFLQAIIVTFADKVCAFIDDIFYSIIAYPNYRYSMNTNGMIAIAICWFMFAFSLFIVGGNLYNSTLKRNPS